MKTHRFGHERDQLRMAEYYTRNGNAVTLPPATEPAGYNTFDWGCFAIGVATIWTEG